MKFAYDVQNNISSKVYNKYINQDLEFHIDKNPSSLIHTISFEINYLIGDFLIPSFIIFSEFFVLFGISLILIIYNPAIFIIILFYYMITILIYFKITKKKNIKLGQDRHFYERKRALNLQNTFYAFKDIKIFLADKFFSNSFVNNIKKLNNVATAQQTLQYIPSRVIEIISVLGFAIIVIYLVLNNYSNNEIIITSGLMVAGAFKIMPSFNRIVSSFQSIRFSKVSLDLLYKEINLKNYNFPEHFKINNDKQINKINLKNINIKYENSKKTIFKNLNLLIEKNQFIGLIGVSGSGKSTLINLILGLIKPTEGMVEYEYSLNSTNNIQNVSNRVFGYIPQEHVLIDDTLISNIAFGVKKEEINLNRVLDCLAKVQLSEFANEIKKNKEFIVKDRGLNLSAGQRQRLAIARALYFDSQIIIFDEATSSLDKDTEKYIMEFIESLKGKKTIIFSSHKEYQLAKCDVVYKIQDKNLDTNK